MFGKIRNWFQNYWYYYKWRVIIISFFAVIILICLIQFLGNDKNPDVTVSYIGPYFQQTDTEKKIGGAVSQIMSSDRNGDGKKDVSVIITTSFTDDEISALLGPEADLNEKMKYAQFTVNAVEVTVQNLIFAGDADILFLDPFWYGRLKDAGALVKLSEIIDFDMKYELNDEYSVLLSDTRFGEFFEEISALPDDTLICFRTLPTSSAFTGKKSARESYEFSKMVLRDILSF